MTNYQDKQCKQCGEYIKEGETFCSEECANTWSENFECSGFTY